MLGDQLRLLIQPCVYSLQKITVYIRAPLSQSSENQLPMSVSNGMPLDSLKDCLLFHLISVHC